MSNVQGPTSSSDITISSWNELNELLYEGAWDPNLGRFRSKAAFRGMTHADYDLRTSLARLGQRAEDLEEHMLRAFRKYASRQVLPDNSIWNWLALAQHHGLSTRLLDWSYSPLVGMHFATREFKRFDCDGVIWVVDFVQTNELLPNILKGILDDEGSDVFTGEMLARAAITLNELDHLSPEPFVAFFEPPSLDDRIVNQYALFFPWYRIRSLISMPGSPSIPGCTDASSFLPS